ncbi:MAG: STAS domain-containing protein [Thiohalocapsa sp.]
MTEAVLEQLDPHHWRLNGSLTLASVSSIVAQGDRLGARGATVELDLAGVQHGSSAAVALLLEWQERARRAGGKLDLRNCPEALWRIAEFSNVDELMGLDRPHPTS